MCRPRRKCPGGTSWLAESVEEGAGCFPNAPCWEDKNSIGKKKEDRNARQAESSERETKSQPGDGGTGIQEE
ncbi:hypothetical protein NDU88_005012 [Pleurodeles waltl]|uniref:Uncharacterized protein n=1 Tax=Pleurodeles waltl TaxID=8319 RepID=A0AAV7TT50_PLEWA|nr:hypothetical protein NDU88_005012 [Pleurodeles waltl]